MRGCMTVAAVSCCALLGMVTGAVASPGVVNSAADGSDLAHTCIEAGLATPSVLTAHFQLESTPAHPRTTEPRVHGRYSLKAMPEECAGKYQRIVKACIRYKTTRLPWKTVTNTLIDGRMPRCTVLYVYEYGPQGKVYGWEVGSTGYFYDFGRVKRVKGRARLIVKDVSTGVVVAQRSLKLPMTFSAKRKMV